MMNNRFFINISNHPSDKWGEYQIMRAKRFGLLEDMKDREIIDIPFPQIDPTEDVVCKASDYITSIACSFFTRNTVFHIMGEQTFCYALINMICEESDCIVVASTTERKVVEEKDGKKTSVFNFVKFRRYF